MAITHDTMLRTKARRTFAGQFKLLQIPVERVQPLMSSLDWLSDTNQSSFQYLP